MKSKIILFIICFCFLSQLFAQTNKDKKPLNQITFQDLSLEEKLAQTIFIATDIDTAYKYQSAIEKGLVGGVLIQWGNYSLEETKDLIDRMKGWAKKSPRRNRLYSYNFRVSLFTDKYATCSSK